MAKSFLALIFLFAIICIAGAAENGDLPEFSKMRVKELRKFLDERGVDCLGCVEKDHILARVKETYHLPVLSEEDRKQQAGGQDSGAAQEPKEAGKKEQREKPSEQDIQRVLEELRKSGKGFDNFKLFTPDDLKKFDLDDFDKKEEL